MINWNFSYVVPSMLIIIIIMGYYFALPRVPLNFNKTFLSILINEGVVIFFDITSSIACNEYKVLPLWLVVALNTCFFMSFTIRPYLYYLFAVNLLKIDKSKYPFKFRLMQIPLFLSLFVEVLNMFFGIIFYVDKEGYHKAPYYFVVYFAYYFYILISIYLIILHRKQIPSKNQKAALINYNFVLFIGTLFRIGFPKYLLFDTFCMMAVIIIYLSFVNPEFYLERRNMCFNSKALRAFVEENEGKGRYNILAFVIRDYHDLRDIYGSVQMNQGICLISEFMKKNYKECLSFYYKSGRFVLLGDPDLSWSDIHEEFRNRFRLPWKADDAELYLEVGYALINCENGYDRADDVLNTISIMLEKADKLGDDYNVLSDVSALQDYYDRVYVKKALEIASDKNQVEVFLQPIISTKNMQLAGAEALARIRDPKGELIPPASFIPIAEQNGRINLIGEQVFEKICKFLSDNDPDSMGLEFVNVNLSPIQFMRADLCDRFLQIVRKYNVSPEKLHIEITEASMIDEVQMNKQMNIMHNEGFRFVVDDYGKGYSNLSRIKKSPFVNIKLDMELVWDYCHTLDPLIPLMISAFKSGGFSVTAEGVETKEMVDTMTEIGCDYLQGYYFSRPLPVDKFLEKYGDRH